MREIEKLLKTIAEINEVGKNDLVKLDISDFIGGNKIREKPNNKPEYYLYNADTTFKIEVICPGLNRKNISVTEDNNVLKIEYKRIDSDNYYNLGSFVLTNRIPHDSDIDNITSEYTDGILKINIPKIKKNPNRIDVK